MFFTGQKCPPAALPVLIRCCSMARTVWIFLTAINCGYVYGVAKDDLVAQLGTVGVERRRMLKRKIIEVLRLL